MSINLTPVLFILIFIGFFVFALTAGIRQAKQRNDFLRKLSSRFGLDYSEPPAHLGIFPAQATAEGTHRGRRLRFYSYTTGSGKHRKTWIALAVTHTGSGWELNLSPENFLHVIGKALGMQDIQTGDTAFDKAFIVSSNAPGFTKAALLPEFREKLLSIRLAAAQAGKIEIRNSEVHYAEINGLTSEASCSRFESVIDSLHNLAAAADTHQKA